MNKLYISALMLATSWFACSAVTVQSLTKLSLPTDVYVSEHALSADGTTVAYIAGDNVVRTLDLRTGESRNAGKLDNVYDLSLSPDGRVLAYFENTYNDHLRYVSLKTMDLSNGKKETVVKPTRHLAAGVTLSKDGVNAVADGTLRTKSRAKAREISRPVAATYYGHLNVTVDGVTTSIDPQGDGSYLWPTISPDGTKVAYWLVGLGCFVCDLDGSNPVSLGFLRAPVWAGNDMVVGMQDYDDGRVVTDSYVVISDLSGNIEALTDDSLRALWPKASADGSKITFVTDAGELYLMTITK